MKAVIAAKRASDHPCVIYWTGREGLSVAVITYCNDKRKATDGVLQIFDDAEVCERCAKAIANQTYPDVR